jgi:hypothetical protein
MTNTIIAAGLSVWCIAVMVALALVRGANPPERIGQRMECEQ